MRTTPSLPSRSRSTQPTAMAVTCKPQQNRSTAAQHPALGNFAWSPPPAQNLVAGTPFSLLLVPRLVESAPTRSSHAPACRSEHQWWTHLWHSDSWWPRGPRHLVAEDSSTPPKHSHRHIIFTVAVPSITNAQAGAAMVGIASIPAALTGIAMNANRQRRRSAPPLRHLASWLASGTFRVHPTVAAVGVASPQSVATGPSSFAPTLTGKGGVESETASGLAGTVLNANPTLGTAWPSSSSRSVPTPTTSPQSPARWALSPRCRALLARTARLPVSGGLPNRHGPQSRSLRDYEGRSCVDSTGHRTGAEALADS